MLVYFWEFGEQRQNTFREPRQLFSGIWGDQCIIFRDQGSTDPLLGGLIITPLGSYQVSIPRICHKQHTAPRGRSQMQTAVTQSKAAIQVKTLLLVMHK